MQTMTTTLLLLALGLGSASISWVRIDGLGNGWMGIQLSSGEEARIQFVDRDGSGDLSAADLRDASRRQRLSNLQPVSRRSGEQQTRLRRLGTRTRLQELGD